MRASSPAAPAELQRIVVKTLRKDRSQRYQTVQDLLLDLQALRDDVHAQARLGSAPVAPIATEPAAAGSSPHAVAAGAPAHGAGCGSPGQLPRSGSPACWACGRGRRRADRRRRPRRPRAAVQRTLTRLTFGSGLQTDATFSPDGRFVAYASDRSGNFDIWVQPTTGGDAVQITRSLAQDTEPDWSPDGATIVFRSDRDGGGLFIMPALGGSERRLTTFGAHPRWSRDGSEILFVVESQPDENGLMELSAYTVAVTGGEPQPVLADFLRHGLWFSASLHPDGRISVVGMHRQLGPGYFTVSRDSKRVQGSKLRAGLPEVMLVRFVLECIGHGALWRGMERRSSESLEDPCGSSDPGMDDGGAPHDRAWR